MFEHCRLYLVYVGPFSYHVADLGAKNRCTENDDIKNKVYVQTFLL